MTRSKLEGFVSAIRFNGKIDGSTFCFHNVYWFISIVRILHGECRSSLSKWRRYVSSYRSFLPTHSSTGAAAKRAGREICGVECGANADASIAL